MISMNPMLITDAYKLSHRDQYPKGTQYIVSNFTPRTSRSKEMNNVVVFGVQNLVCQIQSTWTQYFFQQKKEDVVQEYKKTISKFMGVPEEEVEVQHIESLHDLQYLPIEILSLPEGTVVNIGTPILLIRNTHPDFFWITNYLETWISHTLWGTCTSATIAYEFRKLLNSYAEETSSNLDFVQWQGHDFSMRGMWGFEAAAASGAAHLLSFSGTDTIPAVKWIEEIYGDTPMAGSVPATEHSVMSLGSVVYEEGEFEAFKRLITEVHPKGIISIVSDTYDYWTAVSDFLPRLKDEIMAREGKVVIRPDSGDPVEVICGKHVWDFRYEGDLTNEQKGTVECLWDIFGGTINEKGYKELDPHIGLIYGDSITLSRCKEICRRLKLKGFASTNVVLGIGSYSYQYNTRDTFGFAMKATYGVVNGEHYQIFKSPKGDSKKKSAKGIPIVHEDLSVTDNHTLEDLKSLPNAMVPYFLDGESWTTSFQEVKERLLRYSSLKS